MFERSLLVALCSVFGVGCAAGPSVADVSGVDASGFDAEPADVSFPPDEGSLLPDAYAVDGGAALCTNDDDCGDLQYCDGEERCTGLGPEADGRGCSPGVPPCTELQGCDEDADACRYPECVGARDIDRDGDPSVACGGGDCDDLDPWTSSIRAERCDGIDEDCDGSVDDEPYASQWCRTRGHAFGICDRGSCSFTCELGWFDCDLRDENGCESDPAVDPLACGGCGRTCAPGSWCRGAECGPSTAWSVAFPIESGRVLFGNIAPHPDGGVVVLFRLDGAVRVGTVTHSGIEGFLVARVDDTGAVMWAYAASHAFPSGLAVDGAGTSHVVGFTRDEMEIDGHRLRPTFGMSVGYRVRIARDGTVSMPEGLESSGILTLDAVSGSADALVVSGRFVGVLDLAGTTYDSGGTEDAFILGYDVANELAWHRVIRGSGDDALWSVLALETGGVLAAGVTSGLVTLDGLAAGTPGTQVPWAVELDATHRAVRNTTFGVTYASQAQAVAAGTVPLVELALTGPGTVLGAPFTGAAAAVVALDPGGGERLVLAPRAGTRIEGMAADESGIALAMEGIDPRAPGPGVAMLAPDGTLEWSRMVGGGALGVALGLSERTYALGLCGSECSLGDVTLPGVRDAVVVVAIDDVSHVGLP